MRAPRTRRKPPKITRRLSGGAGRKREATARREETPRREEPLWEGPRESRGHGDQREKSNEVFVKVATETPFPEDAMKGKAVPPGRAPVEDALTTWGGGARRAEPPAPAPSSPGRGCPERPAP